MKRSLILSCAALALAGGALGQTDDGADEADEAPEYVYFVQDRLSVVEVAGLRPVNETDLTTSVTVIDASDLAVRDNPYLADQLRAVPGLGVSRSGAAGGLTQVRIRGAEANHTLVLIDGIEVSDPTTGETDFGLFSGLYPGRVEVARGEQSALYGSDAIGGVINVVTAPSEGFRGLVEGGSFSTLRLDAGYGWDFGIGDLSLTVSDVSSDGVDTSGLDGEKDGYQNTSGTVSGGFGFGQDWEARGLLRYGYGEVDTDPDLDFDGRLDDADRVTESEQWTLGGSVFGEAFGLDHLFRASYNQVERENFGDGASLNVSDADRTKLAYSPSVEVETREAFFTVSGLIDWEQEDYSARDTEFGGFTNQDQTFETLGLAGEVRAQIGDLVLNASARHDDNDGAFDDASTWRLGGAYSFAQGTKLRASTGTGVKNPTFTELFGFFPGSFVGNPDLKPEESTSWEIGLDQDLGPLELSVTYFEADLTDEIFTQFNADFTSTPANRAGDSERSGIEAAVEWQASDSLSLRGAASNISSENDSGADEIRVPEWTGSLALSWRSLTKRGLRAGLALDYVGEQLDTDFATFSTVELDPYTLVSATLDYPVTERISLTFRGENLLDETVTDVVGFNGPGAGLFIGLRVR
ncbi:MAG: TonB-dependent receptor [Henriciella sp.]|nr:TonB-dependent receptor [Henriciella sp.]